MESRVWGATVPEFGGGVGNLGAGLWRGAVLDRQDFGRTVIGADNGAHEGKTLFQRDRKAEYRIAKHLQPLPGGFPR